MTDIRRISLEITGLSTFQQDDRLLVNFLILQSLQQAFPVEVVQCHWHAVGVESKVICTSTSTFPAQINIRLLLADYLTKLNSNYIYE